MAITEDQLTAAIEQTMQAAHQKCQPYFLQLAALSGIGLISNAGARFEAPETISAQGRFEDVHRGGYDPELWGTSSDSSSSRFGVSSRLITLKPVTLPPGRARLATRPPPTGSLTPVKTIGIVEVAFFAASAEGPLAAITSSLRPTRSAANAGSRS
jgi:hypothetical protein